MLGKLAPCIALTVIITFYTVMAIVAPLHFLATLGIIASYAIVGSIDKTEKDRNYWTKN
jgi:hypothetical protein